MELGVVDDIGQRRPDSRVHQPAPNARCPLDQARDFGTQPTVLAYASSITASSEVVVRNGQQAVFAAKRVRPEFGAPSLRGRRERPTVGALGIKSTNCSPTAAVHLSLHRLAGMSIPDSNDERPHRNL